MADPLYLGLWFPDFEVEDMLPHALSVMRQFPFSTQQPGITYASVQPISWNEATILEHRFQPGITAEQAVLVASDLLHDDYAYVFEAAWDLWVVAEDRKQWRRQPSPVKFIVHGVEFDQAAYEQEGHIQVEFGLDAPFLQEEVSLTPEAEQSVRANIQKLVDFASRVEKSSGVNTRLLWSESEDNLAQKLLTRLQRVQ